jgi:hypothetical protein
MGPHYVNFNTAKLLKEKGFDVNVKSYYTTSEEFTPKDYYYFGNEINYNSPVNDVNTMNGTISRPEQWQVVEWLRVEKGILVTIRFPFYGFAIYNKDSYIAGSLSDFNSPQEAYNAAFDYILSNDFITQEVNEGI